MTREAGVKEAICTEAGPTPVGPYSQAVRAGGFLFVAGQGPLDPATRELPVGIEAQTRQVLRNIAAILDAGGCTLDDVVKVTVHLADLGQFGAFNGVYGEYFHEPYPVRTTVGSQLPGILVEIDAIAVAPEAGISRRA